MTSDELLNRRLVSIQRIADRCDDLGKTKVQKISYFLQEAVGAPLMYPFRIHYFGPYSEELDRILSLSKSVGLVDIQPDPNGFGFHVTPLEEGDRSWLIEYEAARQPEIKQIDKVIEILGNIETPRLELYATIHFVFQGEGQNDKDQTLEIVKRLKPKFTDGQRESAYQHLKEVEFI